MDSIFVVVLLLGCIFDGAGFKGRALADHQPRPNNGGCTPVAADDSEDPESIPGSTGCGQLGMGDDHQVRGRNPAAPQLSVAGNQWQVRQRKKQTRIFAIQREILDRLGLRRRPNVTSSNLSPDELDRYEELLRQTETQDRTLYQRDFYAKRYQTILPLCSLPRNSDSSWSEENSNEMRLLFSVEPIEATNRHRETKLSMASLRLRTKANIDVAPVSDDVSTKWRRSSLVSEEAVIRISVFAYTRPVKRNRKVAKRLIQSLLINRNSTIPSWIRLDIRSAVEDWMRRPNRNNGLEVTVEAHNETVNPYNVFERFNCSSPVTGSPPVLGFPLSSTEQDSSDPVELGGNVTALPPTFLDVVTVDVPRRIRSGRGSRDLQTYSQRTYCTLEKMYISFEELGWSDWIVQPKGFETGFCRGSCSKRTVSRTPSWKFATELTSLGLNECCGPVRAKSLSVLHFNEKAMLSVSVFDDFIVSDCGCRR